MTLGARPIAHTKVPMATPKLWAGASGYAFKEWKGGFYPEKIAPDAMLAWYAERLPTVEINNTFYQMPKVTVLERWAEVTPETFRFAIKAPHERAYRAALDDELQRLQTFLQPR